MICINGQQQCLDLDGTPYQGGLYFLSIQFPTDYPFKPPRIKFDTKIIHVNINGKGGIDCSILKENWSPALTISKVLLSIQSCLTSGGNPDDPLIDKYAEMMRFDMINFVKRIVDYNQKYAESTISINRIEKGLTPKTMSETMPTNH